MAAENSGEIPCIPKLGNMLSKVQNNSATIIIHQNRFLSHEILNTMYKLYRGIKDFHFDSHALQKILHNAI